MVGAAILQPVVVLAAWTMVIWVWMYATRIPAMTAAKVDPNSLATDPEADLDRLLPPQVQWKAHNYNHLHEAPTVFYAIAIVLAITGQGDGWNAYLGWVYVGLRIVHSLVQVTINRVILRFALFVASSLALAALILHAAMAVF
ncbi:membrane protein [Erythrobacter sp. SG61-1L]|uniref:MAPEG family protein n=1 Tax=Erythrobacter sp. SG61-1L TaxID=1603897 RepID=UPI0006C90295|nr:MAPEG family protein [Erythrobacter sp. SG61-1L]KPL67322.1 membrane protein [Erythrobacter sp. SG61-1L]